MTSTQPTKAQLLAAADHYELCAVLWDRKHGTTAKRNAAYMRELAAELKARAGLA